MYGRYGMDELGRALTWAGLGLFLISVPTDSAVANGLSLALYAAVLFRMLSRNYAARRAKNAKFLKLAGPVVRWYRLRRTIRQDKEHRYFKCPNCGQQLRVPKGKGTIRVTCRGCGASFQEKS